MALYLYRISRQEDEDSKVLYGTSEEEVRGYIPLLEEGHNLFIEKTQVPCETRLGPSDLAKLLNGVDLEGFKWMEVSNEVSFPLSYSDDN